MTYASASLAYRKAATQTVSPVGLVLALYDALVADLQRAIEALHCNDIQERSNQLKHGFRVLQQLNALVDPKVEGGASKNLFRFYEFLRQRMLIAQFRKDPAILDAAVGMILEVREAWQQVDTRSAHQQEPVAESQDIQSEHVARSFSCSM